MEIGEQKLSVNKFIVIEAADASLDVSVAATNTATTTPTDLFKRIIVMIWPKNPTPLNEGELQIMYSPFGSVV
eukprot:m.142059 g.142059  ORF g.142059 m.142059 type:complete len:73 (+) comp30229_c0_seq3:2113-2331(+)